MVAYVDGESSLNRAVFVDLSHDVVLSRKAVSVATIVEVVVPRRTMPAGILAGGRAVRGVVVLNVKKDITECILQGGKGSWIQGRGGRS